MTTPDADRTADVLLRVSAPTGPENSDSGNTPNPPLTPPKAKTQTINVSPAVIDAAVKEGEDVLRDCRTTLSGLAQNEAEKRARTAGPNEIAREQKQRWPDRILKIARNPLVILLTSLSVISFLTGDPRAGSVMAVMVALSVGLRFWQEARADEAAEKLKAMIHVTATVVRGGVARELPLRNWYRETLSNWPQAI